MSTFTTNSSSNKTNIARLSYAYLHVVPNIWQTILKIYVPETDIVKYCKGNTVLDKKRKTQQEQDEWRKINDAVKNGYGKFDVSLLYKIFRNLTFKKSPRVRFDPPSNGYNSPTGVDPQDFSPGAELERCRSMRNSIVHGGALNVTNATKEKHFKDLLEIVERLEKLYNLQNGFLHEIRDLETCCMDEKNASEYLRQLEEQREKEKDFAERLSNIEDKVELIWKSQTLSDQNVYIKPLEDITCYEGDTVSLDCTVAGGKKPNKWYKEGETVLSDRIIDQSKDQNYKLTFLRVTRADAGVYQVLIGDETRDVRLNVIERQPSLVTLRQYQIELAELALRGVNTIICAGTNAGKTYVAFHVIENHLLLHPKDGKVVFINKTNVLLGQQYKRACDTFVELHMQGKIKLWKADEDDAKEFAKEIGKSSIIFLTPMSLCNHLSDTAEVKVAVGDFTLLVFDECHHVQGNNPYNEIMGHYRRAKYDDKSTKLPQILGLTASPGSNKAKDLQSAKDHIRKIMTNLDVGQLSVVKIHKDELLEHCSMPAKESIRSTTRGDDPVKEIVFDAMKYVEDKLNCRRVSKFLMEHVNASSDLYNALGNPPLQRTEVRYIQWICGTKSKIESVLHLDPQVPRLLLACFRHLELYTECLEVNSLLDIDQVRDVIREGYAAESYSSQKANTDEEKDIIDKMKDVFAEIREIGRNIETNPDIKAVLNKIDSEYQKFQEEARFLIFVKTRATAVALADRLPDYLRATYLTGSHKSVEEGGRPADEQVEILEKFRRGEHLCIVATSVGSEGLDVPQCNVMIRYRFSTDEISSLQMRGRIRRREGTEVIVGTSKEFETESKNIERQYMMTKAVDELSSLDLTRDLALAEKTLYEAEMFERRTAMLKDSQKRQGLFLIYCKSCSEIIADGGSMRHVNNKMYLVCDKQILSKVKETPLPLKKQKKFDGCLKQGKAHGLACGHNWGTIMIYQENKFVALSQDYIKIFDKEKKTFFDCEKWCDLKFRIDPITHEDIVRYNS